MHPYYQNYMYSPCPTPYNPQYMQALELIRKAVTGETVDRKFYEYLINIAPTDKEKEIIDSIRNDEIKHFNMFRKIYCELTGYYPKPLGEEEFKKPKSYLDGIEKALFGELNAVEMYRQIYFGMPSRKYRDMLFEIITDELKHSSKYNFLYTKNQ